METALNKFVLDRVVLAIEQSTYTGDLGITSTTRLDDDLELQGFGRLRLALYLEEIFDIELTDQALRWFRTVGDIVSHFRRNFFQDADSCMLAETV